VKNQLLFIAVIFALVSCGNGQTGNGEEASASEQESAAEKSSVVIKPERGITTVRAPEGAFEKHEDRESQLVEIIMDGTSVETFEASLKQFQETAPTDEYRLLRSALQYLQVYDLSARGNKAKLYEKLNGKTADEIIALAKPQ